ncbi:MAG: hypothetical protein ACFFBT_08665 [Promethearchaeota archaeon]
MKSRNTSIVWLLLIFFIFSIPNVKANPIVLESLYDTKGILYYFFFELPLMFLFTFNAEFLVVYLFLRGKIFDDSKIYKSVLIVNLFTFPITQIMVTSLTFITLFYFLIIYFLIEIIPITVECILINHLFKDFNTRYLEYPGLKKTTSMVITANLLTFLIGFGIYFQNIISIFLIE